MDYLRLSRCWQHYKESFLDHLVDILFMLSVRRNIDIVTISYEVIEISQLFDMWHLTQSSVQEGCVYKDEDYAATLIRKCERTCKSLLHMWCSCACQGNASLKRFCLRPQHQGMSFKYDATQAQLTLSQPNPTWCSGWAVHMYVYL